MKSNELKETTQELSDSERLDKLLKQRASWSKKHRENQKATGKVKILSYFVESDTRTQINELVKSAGDWQAFYNICIANKKLFSKKVSK